MCGGRTSGMPISEWNCRSVCIKSSLSSVTCSCVARAGGYKPMLSSNAASASISEAIAAFVRSELPASPILPSSDVGTRSEPTPPTSVPGPHTDSPIRSSLPCTSTLSRHERLSHSYTSQHSLAERTLTFPPLPPFVRVAFQCFVQTLCPTLVRPIKLQNHEIRKIFLLRVFVCVLAIGMGRWTVIFETMGNMRYVPWRRRRRSTVLVLYCTLHFLLCIVLA